MSLKRNISQFSPSSLSLYVLSMMNVVQPWYVTLYISCYISTEALVRRSRHVNGIAHLILGLLERAQKNLKTKTSGLKLWILTSDRYIDSFCILYLCGIWNASPVWPDVSPIYVGRVPGLLLIDSGLIMYEKKHPP